MRLPKDFSKEEILWLQEGVDSPSPTKWTNDSDDDSDDEYPAPLPKKQRLSDGSSNADSKKEQKTDGYREREEQIFTSDDEGEEEDDCFDNDNQYLSFGPYAWLAGDRTFGREIYILNLAGDAPREVSKCLELLAEIGCEDRYLGCSIETGRSFFASLNEKEAARMQELEGIHHVIKRRLTFCDV